MIATFENGGTNSDCNFEGDGWLNNFKSVGCKNQQSVNFSSLGEIWTGAKLAVVSKESLRLYSQCRCWALKQK